MSDDITLDEFTKQEEETERKSVRWGSKTETIPIDWEFNSIDSYATEIVYPQRDKPTRFDGEIPWVRIEDLDGMYISEPNDGERYVSRELMDEMTLRSFPEGTLMCSCSTTMGVCAITTRELLSNQTFAGIVTDDSINTQYLYYAISDCAEELEQLATGSTISYLSSDKLEQFHIPAPPLSEQRKIATVLHTVDQAIQKTEEIIERGERLHTGLRRDLVISGIDHREFQKMRIGPFEYEIPASWEIVSVDEACTNLDKDRIPIKKSKREEMEGSIPYYGASGIIDHVDDYLFKNDLILLAEDGENLRARNSPISFKISGKAWVNNHAHVFKPKKEFVIDYLVGYFERLNYEPFVTGSAQPKLTQANMEMLSVPKPPKNEQAEISSVLTSISGFKNKLEQNVNRMEHLKKGLMQDLLSGEVRTTDVNIEVPEEVAQYG